MKMSGIYDAKTDEQFRNGFIDIDEIRFRELSDGTKLEYRYMHGGFEGTDVKFSFCFPPKEKFEGRFYQYLSPFPGPDEENASLGLKGKDDKIAFCITHGAYYVETNMGSSAVFSNHPDNTMTHRSSAAAAEFSRVKAMEVYGCERPYGYVYGGSGGGYRTMACIENTNAFDGAVPYVIGSPYAIPNCHTSTAHAERILRNKMEQIIDAIEPGSDHDMFDGLNEEEAQALREITDFGHPLKAWFAYKELGDGALPVLAPGVKGMDPGYFEDFWKVPGYLGAEQDGSAVRDRIKMETKVTEVFVPGKSQKEKEFENHNGVDTAWKKMLSDGDLEGEPWLELEEVPTGEDLYLCGVEVRVKTGTSAGQKVLLGRMEGKRIYLKEGYAMDNVGEVLLGIQPGDEVLLDNSDYIAIQTYHRHQVPSPDYLAWDMYRDSDKNPLYPQRPMLLGPIFSGNGPGCKQNGEIQGKVIVVAGLMDEAAYPWQADWYRRKVASVHDEPEEELIRLWYTDNTLHGDTEETVDACHVTNYTGALYQALLDVSAWVEKGITPPSSSSYEVHGGRIDVKETAKERAGVQPVARLFVNGEKCARIKAGDTVTFIAAADVPEGTGSLTGAEWSFEGEQTFVETGELVSGDDGQSVTIQTAHKFEKAGTYFPVVRVRAERNGDNKAVFTQITNIDRVRVIVE